MVYKTDKMPEKETLKRRYTDITELPEHAHLALSALAVFSPMGVRCKAKPMNDYSRSLTEPIK